MYNLKRKNFFFFSVLLVTLLVGISMASAANSTSDISNGTSVSSTSHSMICTNQINNTIKEEAKVINNNNIGNVNKTLKKDGTIKSWNQLKTSIKSNGTYTLSNNLVANSKLSTSNNTNITINGNGYKITFTKNGRIEVGQTILNIANLTLDGNNTERSTSGIINMGTFSLTNSTLKNFNNIKSEGGAVFNNGTGNLGGKNCIFINNSFINNQAKKGGAIYNNHSSNNSYINNYFTDNSVFLEVQENESEPVDDSAYGGAISNEFTPGNVYINNLFKSNVAHFYGGAIDNFYSGNNKYVSNDFFNNMVTNYDDMMIAEGGAINNFYSGNNSYIKNLFRYNKVIAEDSCGGAINNDNSTNNFYRNNIFINNIAQSTAERTADGGAIRNTGENNSVYIDNTLSCNEGYDGSAFKFNECYNTTLINNMITNNKGSLSTLFVVDSILLLKENSFLDNIDDSNYGTMNIMNSSINIENSKFIGNKILTDEDRSYGGAIYADLESLLNIYNCEFTNNYAKEGGAIYIWNSNFNITNCKFNNNNASSNGAAIFGDVERINSNYSIIISNSSFENNLVTNRTNGETLYFNKIKPILNNNTYINNSIAFSTKKITSKTTYMSGENILINGQVVLKNPSFYDEDILNRKIYNLYMTSPNFDYYTLRSNSTIKITNELPTGSYKVYETLSIAQNTKNNYKTNTIAINIVNVKCSVKNVTVTLGQSTTLSAKFTTQNGKPVLSGKVVVKINGKTLNYTNINNGEAKYTFYADFTKYSGKTYNITFKYGGNTYYSSAESNGTLTIKKSTPKFTYKTTTTTIGKTTKITVKISDKNKKYNATNGKVGIKINGITYKINGTPYIVTPVNGIATFNIPITNKMIGNNNITFTYSGNNQLKSGKTTITNGLIIKTK